MAPKMTAAAASDLARRDIAAADSARRDIAAADSARRDIAASDLARRDIAAADLARREAAAADSARRDIAAADSARREVAALEDRWLHAPDAAALEPILADDFVHVLPGRLATKAEHLDFVRQHPPAAGRQTSFERLDVRIVGIGADVGIATGIVAAIQPDGSRQRTFFTDVFVRRDGRWQAVNAQENPVPPPPAG